MGGEFFTAVLLRILNPILQGKLSLPYLKLGSTLKYEAKFTTLTISIKASVGYNGVENGWWMPEDGDFEAHFTVNLSETRHVRDTKLDLTT